VGRHHRRIEGNAEDVREAAAYLGAAGRARGIAVKWATSAAAIEAAATSLLLIVSPALFAWLLLDAEITEPGQALGRLAGIVLLGFASAA
jgi:hypothetical protein